MGQSLCSSLRKRRRGQSEWPGGSKRARRKDAQLMARASGLAVQFPPFLRIAECRTAE